MFIAEDHSTLFYFKNDYPAMTTSFSSLPIVDLAVLSVTEPSSEDLLRLSQELHDAFATTGFAYLINAPLSFTHKEVFGLARAFFSMDTSQKMKLAKQIFVPANTNTYRGYFPCQPGQQDNLKEGFEIGNSGTRPEMPLVRGQKFQLHEANVWPREEEFPDGRADLQKLHDELQTLSSMLLSLLAVSLDKPWDFFSDYLVDSLSTLRLLHYPPQPKHPSSYETKLCCTPHTDSGILTLLHQDPTGGLEVLNANQQWVPAPYVPGSIVVNIGDLMAEVSGGRFVATMHRVRASNVGSNEGGIGRLSVPFFFEPGESCIVKSVDGGEGILYGEHVRRKMGTWVEFQDVKDDQSAAESKSMVSVEAY
ncbi:putative iron/ascorbate oxidoreductase [Pseudocercospora fuligena]|uniref:Putative iron/ascorbate oxidoreductase n=1 Tax=Pseudocercospora fuligena TaxID=685502 RepID=A0A8H6VGK6_9PEZI|nr:putative iron/ascorbate oxidoreductase [Pseudocercospora fuligena]